MDVKFKKKTLKSFTTQISGKCIVNSMFLGA